MASMTPGAAASTTGNALISRLKNDLLLVAMSVPSFRSAMIRE
jgi:hypothetical protein